MSREIIKERNEETVALINRVEAKLPPDWKVMAVKHDPDGRQIVYLESVKFNTVLEGREDWAVQRAMSYSLSGRVR